MEFNYSIAKKVMAELDSLDFSTSKDKINTAAILCEKNNIPLSDLVLYDKYLNHNIRPHI